MERKVSSIIAAVVLMLTIASSFLLLNFPNLHTIAINKQAEYENRFANRISVLASIKSASANQEELLLDKGQLRIELPAGRSKEAVSFDFSASDECLSIKIEGAGDSYTTDYPIVGVADCIEDVTYFSDASYGRLDVFLDSIYEYETLVEGNYLYLKFIDPHKIYDYVVVVDAGHGGNMPGATREGIMEKNIDLAISNYLAEKLEKNSSIGVYITRDTDSNPSFAKRVGLANDAKADLFVSIHNNAMTSSAYSYVSGTEVLFSKSDESGRSKAFAGNMLDCVSKSFETEAIGVKDGDDIYIIKNAKVPVALVEVGFMSNSSELAKLNDSVWQERAAEGMYDAICKTLGVSE